MKKTVRLAVAILTAPITIPLISLTYFMFGLILIVLFGGILTWVMEYLKDKPNPTEIKDSIDTIKLGCIFIWGPFVVLDKFVRTGEFNID
jgi:hypothetical protein